MHVDVAVIGAGMAGIAAALEIKARGRSVVLIDPSPGGLLRTANGFEVGPQSLLGSADDLWWVLEQLKLTADVVPMPKGLPRFLVRDGRLCPISPSPLILLSTRALTWGERLAVLNELRSKETGPANESVHAFVSRRFGESVAEHVATTALTGVFATPIDQLEAKSALPSWVEAEAQHGSVIRGLLRRPRGAPHRPRSYRLRHGFSSIGAEATRAVPFVAQAVQQLRRSGQGWQLNEQISARALVVAVPPTALAGLGLTSTVSFQPVSIAVVHWNGSDARLPQGFGYLAHPGDGFFALGTIFTESIDAAKPGHFASFVGGSWHPERVVLDDAALKAGLDSDLKRLTGGEVKELLHVERWEQGFTPPRLGHATRVEALRAQVEHDGLFLAGAYLGSGTVRDAASSGRRAGRSAAEHAGMNREASAA